MDDEKLKKQIGVNIVSYRKRWGLTQAALAEKLNYSDKAVSKWERGESLPDVQILIQLADMFQITVNDLLVDPNALPENTGKVEQVMEKAVERTLKRKADKKIILQLSAVLVWFVALLIFVVLSTLDIPKSWVSFFCAVPATGIVLLSLCSAWGEFRWNKIFISVIMWGSLLSIFVMTLVFAQVNVWRIFLLGLPGQLAIYLWFRMFRKSVKEEKNG